MSLPVRRHCATCDHWNPQEYPHDTADTAACQFMPPVPVAVTQLDDNTDQVVTNVESRFPETGRDVWCAQWKALSEGKGE